MYRQLPYSQAHAALSAHVRHKRAREPWAPELSCVFTLIALGEFGDHRTLGQGLGMPYLDEWPKILQTE